MSSIELRIELRSAEDQVQEMRIWVSLSAITLRNAKVHGQDGEQDQKFGEEGFWFFKQEEVQGPTFPRSRSLLTTQGGSLPKSLTEPLLSSQGKEKTTRREGGRLPRPDAPARPPDSIESKQRKLNSIELRVELTWRSPSLRILDSSTINPVPGLLSDPGPLQRFEQAKLHQGQGATHTFKMKKRRKRSHKLDRVRQPSEWSAPDGRLPSPDHDLASQFFGGH
ncbi:unnamed protein product [Microthlaspi erraticum]|uniref:Uncharacterized protein n=1 Tax=Microthlaspi erraticum TaxID=1685480 RepID=A0A6D2KMP4_9BRAS|nr:unnamed protein product [Microthlaspi erraticum]